MQKKLIRLSSVAAVRDFVAAVLTFDFEIDLCSGRYIVDAKSIMGIFSLDLLQPIELVAHTDDAGAFFEKIKDFIVEE